MSDEEKYQSGAPLTPESQPAEVIISPDTRRAQRVPPGQSRTRKWPVLHYAYVPDIQHENWRFDVFGLVDRTLRFTWAEFQKLPRVKVFADFHCVTRWSRLGNLWEGVSIKELLVRAGVQSTAKFAVAHAYDSGWTTNLPFADLDQPDVLLADTHDGEPITADHGGPVRLIVPSLYAWKSAKWIRGLELVAHDQPGYWEQCGYHNHGDPWVQSRQYPDGERFQ